MNKYNVGDIVKLRDDLEDGEQYGSSDYLEEMGIMKNKPITILKIPKLFKDCYEVVDETGENWFLSDEMIEGLWEECKPKLKLIDVLNMIAKGELKEGTKVKYKNIEWEYKTFGKEGEKDLVDKANFTLFEQFYMDALSEEVELIEPECKHEWNSAGKLCGGIQTTHKVCKICGLEEETEDNHFADVGKMAEPTDNTKIEELDKEEMLCLTLQCAIAVLTDKLNEVINKVNAQTTVILAQKKDIDEIQEQLDY